MKTSDWENVSNFVAEHSDASIMMSVKNDENFMRANFSGNEKQLAFVAAFLILQLAQESKEGENEWFALFNSMLATASDIMSTAEANDDLTHSGEQTKMDPKMFFPG